MTNVLQALAGGGIAALVLRLWPVLVGICLGTFIGAVLLPNDDTGRATVWLGVALALYAALGLVKVNFELPRHAETWLSLAMRAATGSTTVATKIFVIPGTPYVQALQFERDKLVQALGLSFTISTVTLALALTHASETSGSLAGPSLLALGGVLVAWFWGKWCVAVCGRKHSGCGSLSGHSCPVPIWRCTTSYDRLVVS